MTQNAAKVKPLIKARIVALLSKTLKNDCTLGEEVSAFEKAEELVIKYEFDRDEFIWPEKPQIAVEVKPKAKPASKGVGKLCHSLLLKHRDWSHQQIAEEVNSRLGSKASASSVAWYAAKMRKDGLDVGRLRAAEKKTH